MPKPGPPQSAAWYFRRVRDFASALSGGDRRSIGRSSEVVAAVRKAPSRFEELWACLTQDDPIVRMRAADALEKLGRENPTCFDGHKKALLGGALDDGTAEVRWHLIVIAARLTLTATEAKRLCAYLDDRLRHDASRIVRVMALQAAFDLCRRHPNLNESVQRMMDYARRCDAPALRARVRKLDQNRSRGRHAVHTT